MRARPALRLAVLALLPAALSAHPIDVPPVGAGPGVGYRGFDDAADFGRPVPKNEHAPVVEWQSFTPPLRPGQSTSFRTLRRHLFPGSTQSRTGGKTNDGLRLEQYWKQAESQTNAWRSVLYANAQGDSILRADNLYAAAPHEAGGDEGGILYRGFATDVPKFVEHGRWSRDVDVEDPGAEGSIGNSTRQPYLAGEGGLVYYRHPSQQIAVTVADYTSPDWTVHQDLAALAEGGWCFALDESAYTEIGGQTRGLDCTDRFDTPAWPKSPQTRGAPDGFCDADVRVRVLDMLSVVCRPGQRCCGRGRDELCGPREFATRWVGQGKDHGAPPAWYIPVDRNGNGTVSTGDYDHGSPAGTLARCEVIARGTPEAPGIRYPIDPDTGHVPEGDRSVAIRFEGAARNAVPRERSEWVAVTGGPPKSVSGLNVQTELFRGRLYGNCCGVHKLTMGGRATAWSLLSLVPDSTSHFALGYAAASAIEIGSNLAGRNGAVFLRSRAGAFPAGGLATFDVDAAEYAGGADYPLLRFTSGAGTQPLDVPLAFRSGAAGDLRTSAGLLTIDAGRRGGREPADGAGLRIAGGRGDVSLRWDAGRDRLVLSGPPGAGLEVFGERTLTAGQVVRSFSMGVFDTQSGLAALSGRMASNHDPKPAPPSDATAFGFFFPIHADAPATVKTLACNLGSPAESGQWNDTDALDLCVVEWPPGAPAAAIRSGRKDLSPCLRLAHGGRNDPARRNPAFSVDIDRRLGHAHTALGLALRNGVDRDAGADLIARCTIEYAAAL